MQAVVHRRASRSAADQEGKHALRTCRAPHPLQMRHAERLREGRGIGSDQVEGACQNQIGRRLKADAVRRTVRRIHRLPSLRRLLPSGS